MWCVPTSTSVCLRGRERRKKLSTSHGNASPARDARSFESCTEGGRRHEILIRSVPISLRMKQESAFIVVVCSNVSVRPNNKLLLAFSVGGKCSGKWGEQMSRCHVLLPRPQPPSHFGTTYYTVQYVQCAQCLFLQAATGTTTAGVSSSSLGEQFFKGPLSDTPRPPLY